jgi:hypothetical protein
MPTESHGSSLEKASAEKYNVQDFDWELAFRGRGREEECEKDTQNCRYIYA